MIAPDIAALDRADIRSLLAAWLLMLAGRAGTAGITTPQAIAITTHGEHTVRQAFQRLVSKRLVSRPSADTKQGKPNRYTIAPDGLALLTKPTRQDGQTATMGQLPLATA